MLLHIFSILRIFLIAMLKQLSSKNCDKIPPSVHESKYNSCTTSSHSKLGLLRNKNCACLDSTHAKSNLNSIIGNDGAIAFAYNYNKYNETIYQFLQAAQAYPGH